MSDQNANDVKIYPPNPTGTLNEAPVARITGSNTGLAQPGGVAVDAAGRIYVTNRGGGPGGIGSITVYAANPAAGTDNEAPLATIAGSNTALDRPYGIAVDPSGEIYVTNLTNTITVYAANPSGTLNEAPLATIAGAATLLAVPLDLAVDAAGKIYVANETGGMSAGNHGSINAYPANPSGTLNEAPIAQIVGSNTGLSNPIGLALDASGKIYATSTGSVFSVTVYAASPTGTINEAPLATITGSATDLGTPSAVALDPTGRIYVANEYVTSFADAAVTVYAANPSGTLNEAPLGTITGSNTLLNSPSGIAVH